jgi:hypothetical protein
MAACACCFTTGLVWLHPSRADWPPSYSYRGRIGSLVLRLACSPCESLPAPLLKPTLARLRAEQAIYTVNSFQFTRSARLILAYPTNGRRLRLSLAFPSEERFLFFPADSPCFHSHSLWSGWLRCQLESSISNRVLPSQNRTESPRFRKRSFRRDLAVTRTRRWVTKTELHSFRPPASETAPADCCARQRTLLQ